jgi:hypothetical protein
MQDTTAVITLLCVRLCAHKYGKKQKCRALHRRWMSVKTRSMRTDVVRPVFIGNYRDDGFALSEFNICLDCILVLFRFHASLTGELRYMMMTTCSHSV